MTNDNDPYFKKIIRYRYAGRSLEFRVSQRHFSSHRIDSGTAHLLKSLERFPAGSFARVLDLGCGYGPLGLALAKSGIARAVHLVDRDALAVEYSRQNAALNAIEGAQAYRSLGYDDVRADDFDLIVSNIPGKAGEQVIARLLTGAGEYLAMGGLVAVVIVRALAGLAAAVLESTPGIAIADRSVSSAHAIFQYRFTAAPDPVTRSQVPSQPDEYLRGEIEVEVPGAAYRLRVAHGLRDFETPGYGARLLIGALQAYSPGQGAALVFNPGQGHVPVALWTQARAGAVCLADADLLALRYSRQNLALNGCDPARVTCFHGVALVGSPGSPFPLVVGLLRGDESAAQAFGLVAELEEVTMAGGVAMIAGGSTAIARVASAVAATGGFRVQRRKKRRGSSLLVLERADR